MAIGLRAGQAFRHIKSHHGVPVGRKGGMAVEKPGHELPPYRPTALPPEWEPPVLPTIASQGDGVPELVAAMDKHFALWNESGRLAERRAMRMQLRTREVVALKTLILEGALAIQEGMNPKLVAERLSSLHPSHEKKAEAAGEPEGNAAGAVA